MSSGNLNLDAVSSTWEDCTIGIDLEKMEVIEGQ
jgi:hypothetical protein